MSFQLSSCVRMFLHDVKGIAYHILVIAISAGIALLLPFGAKKFVLFRAQVHDSQVALIGIEVAVTLLVILTLTYLKRSLRDRGLAALATGVGLVAFYPRRGRQGGKFFKTLQEQHGSGRIIRVMGSSGFSTVADHVGNLSSILDKCLGADVMLVNPYSPEAALRINAIPSPQCTLTRFREEVGQSIRLLKQLKAMGKAVRLKLYSDPPLMKMVFVGDYLWLQHYPPDVDVQTMPEYIFQHHRHHSGLYNLYAQHFEKRWRDDDIPEYDFETDCLVYRSRPGETIKRPLMSPTLSRQDPDSDSVIQDVQTNWTTVGLRGDEIPQLSE